MGTSNPLLFAVVITVGFGFTSLALAETDMGKVTNMNANAATTQPVALPEEPLLEAYRRVSGVLGEILDEIEPTIRPGLITQEIERQVGTLLKAKGVESSFKGYGGNFPNFITASVNNEVINTLPSARILKRGDLLKLQIGITDGRAFAYQSWTYPVGELLPQDGTLYRAGLAALDAAIAPAKTGKQVRDISSAIDETLKRSKFSGSRDYVGHAMWKNYRERPRIPCFIPDDPKWQEELDSKLWSGQLLNLVVIAHGGTAEIKTLKDGWNVVSVDGEKSVSFGQMIVVAEDGANPLTKKRSTRAKQE